MKNLSYQIKGNQVVFKLIVNTISYYSISNLVSQKLIDYVMESASVSERIISEINEGNDLFYLEQFLVYNNEKHLLLAFDINKGKRLRNEEKVSILEEIKLSIQNQKPFSSLSLFEIRVHDLDFFEYTYFIEELEITNLYQYQIYHKQYLRA